MAEEVKNTMREAFAKGDPEPPLKYQFLAELVGTFLLLWIGDMSIATAFMGPSGTALFQIVMGWFFAVCLPIYAIGGISGAHINPAVTIALWATKRFPGKKVIPYIVAQFIGAFLGAFFTWLFWHGVWNYHAVSWSQILNCHYPNPAVFPAAYPKAWGGSAADMAAAVAWANAHWPLWLGYVIEFIMTFFLLFTIVTVTDTESPGYSGWFAGFIIALYVGFACFIDPQTMTCMNPARDWGPRVMGAILGYGGWEWPGMRWEIFMYIIPQIVGGVCAAFFYDKALKPYFKFLKEA